MWLLDQVPKSPCAWAVFMTWVRGHCEMHAWRCCSPPVAEHHGPSKVNTELVVDFSGARISSQARSS